MLVCIGAYLFEPIVIRKLSGKSALIIRYYYWILPFTIFYTIFSLLNTQSDIHKKTVLPNFLNSNNTIVSTVGESFIGKSSNIVNQNQIGFWYSYQQTTITDVENEETIPTVFKLEQNYPNPFNPSTRIKFAVPEKSNVLIKVYDILGSEVATLVNKEMDAGWYENNFNAAGLSSGVYLFRMEAGSYVSTKKMIYLR